MPTLTEMRARGELTLDLGESGILLLLLSWTFSERPGVHKRRSIQSDTNRFGI